MKRYAALATLALGLTLGFCFSVQDAHATDKNVDSVVTDGGTPTSISLDCGYQYGVQCTSPHYYRTCTTSTCVAASTDVLLDAAPRVYDILIGGGGAACDHYFSFKAVGDAGTCNIAKSVPRTVPIYP